MTISRELLKKAWPDGYLPMRGVNTVEGWVFISSAVIFTEYRIFKRNVDALTYRIIHHKSERHKDLQEWIDAGDLFPWLGPASSPATWTCVKQDLANACPPDGNPLGKLNVSQGLTFRQTGKKAWELSDADRFATRHFVADTDDPATALVIALAHTRQEKSNVD